MFDTNRRLTALERDSIVEMNFNSKRYWELKNTLSLILNHLNLQEVDVPAKKELRGMKNKNVD